MNIQNILWPRTGMCTETEMYYRRNKAVEDTGEETLVLKKGALVQFDTYFNGLSIEKWRKYTKVNQVSLRLYVKGHLKITLFHKMRIEGEVFEKVLSETLTDTADKREVVLDYPEDIKGILAFRIESLEDGGIFYGGYYDTRVCPEEMRDVKIGIVICTYRRETFVENNVRTLNTYIIDNAASPLKDKIEVFIADNGQSLNAERLGNKAVHIVRNKNTGGAGGFTRGLIEILEKGPESGITHVLFMDDDVMIEPEALVKTYHVLSLLKEEYIDAFIGGAMLRSDKQNIQVESGASWNEGKINSLKSNLDMNSCSDCLYNETEEYVEYNAWWYCCVPVTVVSPENLPMPLFIRGDDVEYGLRNMKYLILMNGICIWHEPFERKYSSFLFYYMTRNQLINNSIYCSGYSKKKAELFLLKSVLREALYYRYENVKLILKGAGDYLEGVNWLLKMDGEALHKEILTYGYKSLPLEQLDMPFSDIVYERSKAENNYGIKKYLHYLTGNGFFLKAKRDNIVSMSGIRLCNTYRVKRIMNYDETTGKAFVTEKNNRKLYQCIKALGKMIKLIDRNYDRAREEYRERRKEVQSIEFWKKYLNYESGEKF